MRCTACAADNAPERRFCGACGAPLARACTACGFANEAQARFCGGCGAGLGDAPDLGDGEPGERRQVTVLFADLSGFTRMAREIGAEPLHGLLERYFAVADQAIAEHGGTVDKHLGDAVMGLFGAPIAHHDDPLRAVRTALAIHDGLAALSAELDQPLACHIGIACGEVVASGTGSDRHRTYTVTGDSVNLAARLTDRAEPGETLVSEAVRQAVERLVRLAPAGALELDGIEIPVPAWRVRGLEESRPAARPLVGRRAELEQFRGLMRACLADGAGATLYVRGEAGIGKSRLVEELGRIAAEAGFARHVGLVLDFGAGTGRDAIRALVRSLLGAEAADEREAAARRAIAEGLVAAEAAVHLNDLLELPQPLELRAVYDAMDAEGRAAGKRETVVALARALAARQARMLVVEDLHWADGGTLAHAAALAAAVAECPALLVLTSRIEGDPLDHAWRATTRGAPLLTVDLGPLRHDEALALACALLGAEEHARRCVERAEGNPLFLEQLARAAGEGGDGLPGSIQSIVLARIDRLPPEDKRALQAASVIGQRFSLELLRELIGRPGYECAAPLRHYLVRRDGAEFLFAHALIQDGVYGSLLGTTRRELHRAAARWLRERDLVLAAEHLERAEDPEAPRALHDAAREQAGGYRYERALQLAARGLALCREQADRVLLTALRAELLNHLGSVPESIACWREVLELATDDATRCRAWLGVAAGMRITDQYDDAFAAVEEAERLAGALGLLAEHARALWLRGNLCFPLGRLEACHAAHTRALELARQVGSPELEARALGGLGDAHYAARRMITAHDAFRGCVELARRVGQGRIEVANQGMIAHTTVYFGSQGAAAALGLEAAAAAARVGHHRAELNARLAVYFARFQQGDDDAVREQVALCQALIRRLGAWRFETASLIYLGRVALVAGDRAEARRLLLEAWRIAQETGKGFNGPQIKGVLALAAGDDRERRAHLEEGEALLAAGSIGHNHLRFLPDAIESALQAGEPDEARRFAAMLEDATREEPLPFAGFQIRRGRVLAALAEGGRSAEAEAELEALRAEARRLDLKRPALPA
jgi:class 3 adenylate cyclase/tetratricopeptide (TPR) repeat protein